VLPDATLGFGLSRIAPLLLLLLALPEGAHALLRRLCTILLQAVGGECVRKRRKATEISRVRESV
jgi:hypothetical protein